MESATRAMVEEEIIFLKTVKNPPLIDLEKESNVFTASSSNALNTSSGLSRNESTVLCNGQLEMPNQESSKLNQEKINQDVHSTCVSELARLMSSQPSKKNYLPTAHSVQNSSASANEERTHLHIDDNSISLGRPFPRRVGNSRQPSRFHFPAAHSSTPVCAPLAAPNEEVHHQYQDDNSISLGRPFPRRAGNSHQPSRFHFPTAHSSTPVCAPLAAPNEKVHHQYQDDNSISLGRPFPRRVGNSCQPSRFHLPAAYSSTSVENSSPAAPNEEDNSTSVGRSHKQYVTNSQPRSYFPTAHLSTSARLSNADVLSKSNNQIKSSLSIQKLIHNEAIFAETPQLDTPQDEQMQVSRIPPDTQLEEKNKDLPPKSNTLPQTTSSSGLAQVLTQAKNPFTYIKVENLALLSGSTKSTRKSSALLNKTLPVVDLTADDEINVNTSNTIVYSIPITVKPPYHSEDALSEFTTTTTTETMKGNASEKNTFTVSIQTDCYSSEDKECQTEDGDDLGQIKQKVSFSNVETQTERSPARQILLPLPLTQYAVLASNKDGKCYKVNSEMVKVLLSAPRGISDTSRIKSYLHPLSKSPSAINPIPCLFYRTSECGSKQLMFEKTTPPETAEKANCIAINGKPIPIRMPNPPSTNRNQSINTLVAPTTTTEKGPRNVNLLTPTQQNQGDKSVVCTTTTSASVLASAAQKSQHVEESNKLNVNNTTLVSTSTLTAQLQQASTPKNSNNIIPVSASAQTAKKLQENTTSNNANNILSTATTYTAAASSHQNTLQNQLESKKSTVNANESIPKSKEVATTYSFTLCVKSEHQKKKLARVKEEMTKTRNITLSKYYVDSNSKDIKYNCMICEKSCKKIVDHYVRHHPQDEVLISRLKPTAAQEAMASVEDTPRYRTYPHYLCRFCDSSFTSKNAFKDHTTTHTGEYRYQCGNCEFKSSSKLNVELHMQKHHDDDDDDADDGRCVFKVKKLFRIHGEEYQIPGYICTECNYVQISHENVKNHITKYHNSDESVKDCENLIREINFVRLSKKSVQNNKPVKTPNLASTSTETNNGNLEREKSVPQKSPRPLILRSSSAFSTPTGRISSNRIFELDTQEAVPAKKRCQNFGNTTQPGDADASIHPFIVDVCNHAEPMPLEDQQMDLEDDDSSAE